jgi:hypothetical protein
MIQVELSVAFLFVYSALHDLITRLRLNLDTSTSVASIVSLATASIGGS